MRLLEKDREARFQSAEELAHILEQCLAHVQKPTTEPLPLAVVPKKSFFDRGRIRNWIVAGMASAFLFFAGVLIILETNKGTITIKSEADNVPIRIKRSDKVVDEMVVSRTGKSVRLAAGEYVIEFDGDSQDLVVEGGNVPLVRGETKTLQIVYRKSDGAETRMNANKSESEMKKSEVNAPEYSTELADSVDEFNSNRENSAQLYAANSPMLTEDELCAALWMQANHTEISSELRKQFRAIVLDRRLPPGWSIRLKKVQWDMDKRWHDAPATSSSIEIHLMQRDQVVSTIRSQFVSSGLASTKRSPSPLADAIERFNKEHAGDQPPLTIDETLAALSTIWLKSPDQRSESFSLTEDAVSRLMQVADTHIMDGVTIQPTLRTHEVGDSNFITWSIDLAVMSREGIGWAETFQIRKRFLKVDSARISPVAGQGVVQDENPPAANLSQPQFDAKVQVPLAVDASLDWSVSPSLVVSMEEALQQVESQLEGTGAVAILMQQERLALSKVGPVIHYAIKAWTTGNGNSLNKGDWIDINVCLHELDPSHPDVVPLLRNVRVVGITDDHPESTLNRLIAIELELTQIEIDRLRSNESRNSFTFSRSSISH